MASTIKLKNGSGAPLASDLVQGEPAFDLTNKRLYTEDSGGTVIEIGTSPSTIDINAGTVDGISSLSTANGTDVSFAGVSGTKFFWDASAESLGIGTTSPTDKLHVGTNSGSTQLKIQSGSSINNCILHTNGTTDSWRTGMNLVLTDGSYEFYDDVNNVDRMVITSSGNLLVGKTTADSSVVGAELRSGGRLFSTVSNDYTVNLNRLNSDGDIAVFRKDGTTVGSIAVENGNINIGSGDTGLRFDAANNALIPVNISTNAVQDNTTDIGSTNYRWKDLYLSGGVYLGGTGAANHLDDYEEGTWTPTITRSDGTEIASGYVFRSGTYTKVGRLVYVQFGINLSGVVNQDGSELKLTGLPFNGLAYTGYSEPSNSAQTGVMTDASLAGAMYVFKRASNDQIGFRAGYTNTDSIINCNVMQAGSYISATLCYYI